MTEREELITALHASARRSEDLAAALEAVAARHRPEYDACFRVPAPLASAAQHKRMLELYPHVIESEKDAQRLHAEADMLREVAELLKEMLEINEIIAERL